MVHQESYLIASINRDNGLRLPNTYFTFKRDLSNKPLLQRSSFMQQDAMCSVGGIFRLVYSTVCFVVGLGVVGESSTTSISKGCGQMKKYTVGLWVCYFVLTFSSCVRGTNLIELHSKGITGFGVSCLGSTFCSVDVLCMSIRVGLGLLSSSSISVLCCGIACGYLIGLSVKVISGGRLSTIRSMLATR